MRLHDTSRPTPRGRPRRDLEVVKSAALILTVTAWEAFTEDTLLACFGERLHEAKSPADVSSAFNATAENWLHSGAVKPPDLGSWAGDGWKGIVMARFTEQVASLNTPKSENVRRLYRRYLGSDITEGWRWRGVAPEDARQQLDRLIALRGELVHRGSDFFDVSGRARVRLKDVTGGIRLVNHLVDCTGRALGRAPHEEEL